RAASESGSDQKRVSLPEDVYTGIWWYARFPNHYSGDGSAATHELGEWNMNHWIADIVEAIRAVKADDQSLKLQNEFYEKSKHPLDTRPGNTAMICSPVTQQTSAGTPLLKSG